MESSKPRRFTFIGGDEGVWRVARMDTITGEPLPNAERLEIVASGISLSLPKARWLLLGITSNERYITQSERDQLTQKQPVLGRPDATYAALIPIRKNAGWWSLPQDERRRIFEESSKHVKKGLRVLPAVARRLHQCRDLGGDEPFDFLTWFEFAPSDSQAFDELVSELRATEEWTFVDREVDIRVVREDNWRS